MKKQIRVSNFKSEEQFNVGDNVNICDGSALSCVGTEEDVYIVFAYPNITGTDKTLKELTYKVTRVDVDDSFLFARSDWGYLQDIEMEYNGVKFKTASGALRKAKLYDLKKQAEPKEGEWWYFDNRVVKGVVRYKKNIDDDAIEYSEGYFEDYSATDSCCDNYLKHIATTEEITYFMGLHAERLGLVKGAIIKGFVYDYKVLDLKEYIFVNGCLKIHGDFKYIIDGDVSIDVFNILRNSEGTWATVVTEKPKNGKLKAKIAELEERIQKAKDILDGK